jgi:transposase
MRTIFQFDPLARQLTGPTGSLPILPTDPLAPRLFMLIEGECFQPNITAVAQKYGFSRPRYYQLLTRFKRGGLPALQLQKTGPKSNYRRTDQLVRQVLRYRFLDPEASPEVITQKLRQTHFSISRRSVQRVLADYGLQKKTLRPQPAKPTPTSAHPAARKTRPPRSHRRPQRGTAGPTTPGR